MSLAAVAGVATLINCGTDASKVGQSSNISTGSEFALSTEVIAYADPDFSGGSQQFGVGIFRANEGHLSAVGNDRITSLRVPSGMQIRLCEHEGANNAGGGLCRTYAAGDTSQLTSDIDNRTSFIEVTASGAPSTPLPPDAGLLQLDYEADTSTNFPNPERGVFRGTRSDVTGPRTFSNEFGPDTFKNSVRGNNESVFRRLYNLIAFRTTDTISPEFLAYLKRELSAARQAGVKFIVRFGYDFDGVEPSQDPPLARVLKHIEQIAPVLREDADVIAYIDAGFAGEWGEWHHSGSGLDSLESKKAILEKLLASLPANRMISVRYPRDKRAILGSAALTGQEAFTGTARARVGHHNDCFLYNKNDYSTYYPSDEASIEEQKNYLGQDSLYVPQQGETCYVDEEEDPLTHRGDCPTALAEFKRMRWSSINRGWDLEPLFQRWTTQGCYEQITRSLGYRFRLTSARVPRAVRPGNTFNLQFTVTNDGWASPINKRPVEVVLRRGSDGLTYRLRLEGNRANNEDPRFWQPNGDDSSRTYTVSISAGLPSDMPAGDYVLFLSLPDEAASLHERPEYSIRLANSSPNDLWDSSKGYNWMQHSVKVESTASGQAYSGSKWFSK